MARMTAATLERVAERFQVLGEPMRLRLLNELREAERTVTELCDRTGCNQANASKHLAVLLRHGLVARRREGLHAHYRIADPGTLALCDAVCGSVTSSD